MPYLYFPHSSQSVSTPEDVLLIQHKMWWTKYHEISICLFGADFCVWGSWSRGNNFEWFVAIWHEWNDLGTSLASIKYCHHKFTHTVRVLTIMESHGECIKVHSFYKGLSFASHMLPNLFVNIQFCDFSYLKEHTIMAQHNYFLQRDLPLPRKSQPKILRDLSFIFILLTQIFWACCWRMDTGPSIKSCIKTTHRECSYLKFWSS